MNMSVLSLVVLSVLLLAIVVVAALVYLLRGGRGRNCGVCGYPLRREWKVCPMCGADGARCEAGPVIGDQRKARSRMKGFLGLTAVICVPVVLCVVMGLVMMPGINNHPTSGIFSVGLTREDLGTEAEAFLEAFEASDDGGFARSEYGSDSSFKVCMWLQTEKGEEWNEHMDYYLLYINRDDLEYVSTDDGVGTYGFALRSAQKEQEEQEVQGKQEETSGNDGEKEINSGNEKAAKGGFVIIGEQGYVGRNGRTLTIDGVSYDVEVRDAKELPFDLKALVRKEYS